MSLSAHFEGQAVGNNPSQCNTVHRSKYGGSFGAPLTPRHFILALHALSSTRSMFCPFYHI